MLVFLVERVFDSVQPKTPTPSLVSLPLYGDAEIPGRTIEVPTLALDTTE